MYEAEAREAVARELRLAEAPLELRENVERFLISLKFNHVTGKLAHADYGPLTASMDRSEIQGLMAAIGVTGDQFAEFSDRVCLGLACTNASDQYCNPLECRGH